MTAKKLVYYILAAFIAGTLTLVYIQYNSSKNINELIRGNELLLGEMNVSNQLKDLEKGVLTVESKVRGAVTTRDTSLVEGLAQQMARIDSELLLLQKLSDNDSSILFIDQLDDLVHEKLLFNRTILDSLREHGKASAEALITTKKGHDLTIAITSTIEKVDSARRKILAETTAVIDRSGKRALQLSTILIVIVLISAAGLFWYIINIIRKQLRLIDALNISEKQVLESARIKENFLANMSHEIRTPMHAILGFTNLLQRRQLDNTSKEYVQTIQKSSENLLSLINDILDLSKIEAGMMRIESVPFSIRGLLHSVTVMLRSRAAEKGIGLEARVAPGVPDTLEGDASRLTQILVNLIGNAIKFTQQGKVTVHIEEGLRNGDVLQTRILVKDTGIGIAAAKQAAIFDRFRQAEDNVTRQYGGTGLGLSIVQELVSLQNGQLLLESEPGKGSLFTVILPYHIAKDQPAGATEESNTSIDLGYIKLLVAEDNPVNQQLIRHLFHEWNISFDLVGNGLLAIEKLKQEAYDLVLMDIQMPEMDGYTAARHIRDVLHLSTPVIAMTAHAFAGEREKCLSFGMNEYIAKPIREEQLKDLLIKFTGAPVSDRRPTSFNEPRPSYQHIDLTYMKEVSGGDKEYEQTVTAQFIEAIPEDLANLQQSWQHGDHASVKRIAHNMKTTVSIMGLDIALQPFLDRLEYDQPDSASFATNFAGLQEKCMAALDEAAHFLTTLK
ncbi:ATP-binding protein [Terrimonas ferruginea]|uniref:ATP-binding protein n=1 Tax=Terrimonas ferruginea TaxID=249 RepID=UPI00040A54A7|nr:ATP-binding protein [Terrimonas ferruginea]